MRAVVDSMGRPAGRPTGRVTVPPSDAAEEFRLPRTPVFGWSAFGRDHAPPPTSVDDLPHRVYTTSGRAAIFQALLQLGLPRGSVVLVPTYHCPTMVAPVLCAGMQPRFFGIDADGLPDLTSIDRDALPRAGAIVVAQYFGLPRSLAAVRDWCDRQGVALIEDCAHSYFGNAGERPIGGWGDLATASVSKFFPVSEAGVLASNRRPLTALTLRKGSVGAQLKCLLDVVELGTRYGRFPGLDALLKPLFRWKNRNRPAPARRNAVDPTPDAQAMMLGCDMGRIEQAPLWVSMQIARRMPRTRIVAQRRANFRQLLARFEGAAGARALCAQLPDGAAPYVFPLWVDDADRVYHALRGLAAPVFRWDHIWPTTPALDNDQGRLWSRHVLQLLCHQDLSAADIEHVAGVVLHLLNEPRDAHAPTSP